MNFIKTAVLVGAVGATFMLAGCDSKATSQKEATPKEATTQKEKVHKLLFENTANPFAEDPYKGQTKPEKDTSAKDNKTVK